MSHLARNEIDIKRYEGIKVKDKVMSLEFAGNAKDWQRRSQRDVQWFRGNPLTIGGRSKTKVDHNLGGV